MNATDLVTMMTKTQPSNILEKGTNEIVRQTGEGETNATNETDSTTDTDSTTPFTDSQRAGEEFDTFLRLLTAQIKNQDPLAPLDSTQFVEQLATFSGLELQASGNQHLEAIERLLAERAYENTSDAA